MHAGLVLSISGGPVTCLRRAVFAGGAGRDGEVPGGARNREWPEKYCGTGFLEKKTGADRLPQSFQSLIKIIISKLAIVVKEKSGAVIVEGSRGDGVSEEIAWGPGPRFAAYRGKLERHIKKITENKKSSLLEGHSQSLYI